MGPWVIRVLGDTPVRLLVHPGHTFRIGRDTEADLCLDDKLVSRRHAELLVGNDGSLEAKDLGSRNGTRLNGRAFRGSAIINAGDELKIGAAIIVIEGPQGAPGHVVSAASSAREHTDRMRASDFAEADVGPAGAAAPEAPAPAAKGDAGNVTFSGQAGDELSDELERALGPEELSVSQRELPPNLKVSLPGFELLAEVSRGRTGIIYRARTLGPDGQETFVKILDTSFAASDNAILRFESEAHALSLIDHPNIVRLGQTGTLGTRRFYTMEWIDGSTLAKVLRGGKRIEPREAISIGAQIARGLSVAHAAGFVHRDIAPASIFITPEGVAKIFDFAFVKTQEQMPSFTNLGDVVGDLRYTSPEQAANPRAADLRSDLYALGATLYHAVSGAAPIEGKNYLETYRRIVGEVPPLLSESVPEARPRLAQTVARLLAKDMDARFQSGAEVAQALAEALLEAIIAARTTIPPHGAGIGADFRGLELLEIVQVLEARHASGVLTVAGPEAGVPGDPGMWEGEIRVKDGKITGARAPGEDRTLPAVATLLDLSAGAFAFKSDPNVAPGLPGPPLSASELALAALRRRSFFPLGPAGDAPDSPAPKAPKARAVDSGGLDAEEY